MEEDDLLWHHLKEEAAEIKTHLAQLVINVALKSYSNRHNLQIFQAFLR